MKIGTRGQGLGARVEEQGGGGAGERGEEAGGTPAGQARVSLLAAVLFFVGLGAGCGAVVMAGVFFWPWVMRGMEWVGWVVRSHPGLVMIGLIVVAVGGLRLSRWVDERGE